MKVASISELKDGLSAHLEWVRSGEVVVVTDRRSPVATLERIQPGSLMGEVVGLVAEGIVAPPKARLDAGLLLSMQKAECAGGLVAAIEDERNSDR